MLKQSAGSPSKILGHQVSKWIIDSVDLLENGRAKFCAVNSLRFLHWAIEIFETSPIVASFCTLNATEEAVTAFISAAKKYGHDKSAKQVNLHDHYSKALISVFAQRCSRVAKQGRIAIAVSPSRDVLAFRVPYADSYRYAPLHLSSFRVNPNTETPENGKIQLGDMPPLEDLHAEVQRVAEARNQLLYATNSGIQTGFENPEVSLLRDTQLSLGLIWAMVDIYKNPEHDRPFIDQVLEGIVSLDARAKTKCGHKS